MELKYPKSKTSIDDMCEIIKFFGIKNTEYTDCTILYEVTFDRLRAIYNLGKDQAGHNTQWESHPNSDQRRAAIAKHRSR
jgi:hypothetical protein